MFHTYWPPFKPDRQHSQEKHGLIFTSIKTVSGRVSTAQLSSIWSDYGVCWENTANISFTTALRFPFCLCFPYCVIIRFLSLSVDMLALCRVRCGLPGGTVTSLQLFPVTVAHNWAPTSHKSMCFCICVLARICACACALACQPLGWRTDPWAPRSPELLWRHSVSLEMLGTAEIVQSASLFTRLNLGIFGRDVLYLIAVE